MHKNEFVKKILAKYNIFFNSENTPVWVEDYNAMLQGDIDYKYLYNLVIKEYESVRTPPSPALIKCLAKRSLNTASNGEDNIYSNKYKPVEEVEYNNEVAEYAKQAKEIIRKRILGTITQEESKEMLNKLKGKKEVTNEK